MAMAKNRVVLAVRSADGSRIILIAFSVVIVLSVLSGCAAFQRPSETGGFSDSGRKLANINGGNYNYLVHEALTVVTDPDASEDVRKRLITALGISRDPRAMRPLTRILLDGDMYLACHAAIALAQVGGKSTLGIFREAEARGRLDAGDAVYAIGLFATTYGDRDALLCVQRVLETDLRENVRLCAVCGLHGNNSRQAMVALRRASRLDTSMRVRVAAAGVLGENGGGYDWALFKAAAANADRAVREEVIARVPLQDQGIEILLNLLDDQEVAGAAWERLSKDGIPQPDSWSEAARAALRQAVDCAGILMKIRGIEASERVSVNDGQKPMVNSGEEQVPGFAHIGDRDAQPISRPAVTE